MLKPKTRRRYYRPVVHTHTTVEGHVYTFWRDTRRGGTSFRVAYAGGDRKETHADGTVWHYPGSSEGWTNIGVKAFRKEREFWDEWDRKNAQTA